MAARPQTGFRFLDFPVELRLMVYEFLPITSRHHSIFMRKPKGAPPEYERPSLIVINLQVPLQILRVCRTVQSEAQTIMMLQVQRIKEQTPRIIVDSGAMPLLSLKNGVLTYLTHWIKMVRNDEEADFNHWVRQKKFRFPLEVRRFIRQAGIQMLNQWQKLEYPHRIFHGDTAAALFLACRMQTSPCHEFWSRNGLSVRSFFKQKLISGGRQHNAASLRDFSPRGNRLIRASRSFPFGGVTSVITWAVPVHDEQKAQVSKIELTSADLLACLGTGRSWVAGVEIE